MFTGRRRRLGVPGVVLALVATSVALVAVRAPARADVVTPQPTGNGTSVAVLGGDFTGDGKTDVAVTGSSGFSSVPVAASVGDGTFTTTAGTLSDPDWAAWAAVPGVRVVTGDFNGDHKTDLALLPPLGAAGAWSSIPVAMSAGNGSFTVTNGYVGDFAASWAPASQAQVLTGDFNGDGKTDIALLGVPGYGEVRVAYSNGDGSFTVAEVLLSVPSFSDWAADAGVHAVAGDFNGDGRTDIALAGGPGWAITPVALSDSSGEWTVDYDPLSGFPAWSAAPGARVLTGDFNHDGKADIALAGGQGWTSIPIALSNGDGTFTVVNQGLPNFGGWAYRASILGTGCVDIGDFNGDGLPDIALPCVDPVNNGGTSTFTLPVAFSNGSGGFTITDSAVGQVPPDWAGFGYKARQSLSTTVVGDFNGDGKTDFAVVTRSQNDSGGPAGVPMAFSDGDGSFTLTDQQAPGLVSNLDGIPGGPDDFDLNSCTNLQMCQTADVDGDGHLDRVGFVPATTQYPALAGDVLVDTGHGMRIWGTGFCLQPQETCTLASVDAGNIAADIVQFDNSTPGKQGNVEVALSNPASRAFGPLALWGQNLCPVAGETCGLANVNGDVYPDVVDFTRAAPRPGAWPGSVIVGLGSGHDFGQATLWGAGICTQAADFCSVGLAFTGPPGAHTPEDILQVTPDGAASVSVGDGTGSFGSLQQWGTGLCVHATTCELFDINGDGIGDVVYKDASDTSLSTSQVWVAYGRNDNSYAAPVIFDVKNLPAAATTAAVTGPRPPGGITLAAYTVPATSAVTCASSFVSANDHFWAARYFNHLGWSFGDVIYVAALKLGLSPVDASNVETVARQPFIALEQAMTDASNDSINDFLSMNCPGTPLGPDPWGGDD